jgi:cytidylate kinase
LKDKGLNVSLADLSREIAERDARDATRAVAPLVAAPDAVTLDSTSMTAEAVVHAVIELTRQRIPGVTHI